MIEMIREQTCIRCFQCVEACPCDVIQVRYEGTGNGRVYIGYPDDCMTCQLCVEVCPADDQVSPSRKPIFVGPERGYKVAQPW